MQNKLTQLFASKPKNLLNIFFTAGYPKLEDTTVILKALEESKVDLVEIGIPFSDPLADGPTIQESSKKALENGMSIEKLFTQLEQFKNENPDFNTPILLMGYLNPVMQFGLDKFCARCASVGMDGLIIPDLPMYSYQMEFKDTFEKHNISNVFLVTPQTSEKRIREIDANSTGFIYAVSSASTTGTKADFSAAADYLGRLRDMNLNTPVLTGFNIKNKQNFQDACNYVDGAIIGSEFIRQISDSSDLERTVSEFVKSIKG
ncbi:tryptophan synthase subunit alpha [Nonlabens ponticola]|uniref:Tryptophan synthase alpha chain n=1 Tax=Nonlabens ponticola TaxID=2496866 RepID=A0A3S9N0X3_9FLAO|nr:tryptophan synthase subunit alpha [Nonlabens ponticola]AZQ45057.1 tryptophan synthase subunit alpha [Nonlabens ponticola]